MNFVYTQDTNDSYWWNEYQAAGNGKVVVYDCGHRSVSEVALDSFFQGSGTFNDEVLAQITAATSGLTGQDPDLCIANGAQLEAMVAVATALLTPEKIATMDWDAFFQSKKGQEFAGDILFQAMWGILATKVVLPPLPGAKLNVTTPFSATKVGNETDEDVVQALCDPQVLAAVAEKATEMYNVNVTAEDITCEAGEERSFLEKRSSSSGGGERLPESACYEEEHRVGHDEGGSELE